MFNIYRSFNVLGLPVLTVLTLAFVLPHVSYAIENEKVLGSKLSEKVKKGETVWINNGANKFFSIFIPDLTGQPKGAAIIVHDGNAHPDWPEVIHPLRTYLPHHGWATLSVHVPQIETIEEYTAIQNIVSSRIEKASAYLREIGYKNIALLGHGTGAMAATRYLAANSNHDMRGFVAISLGVIESQYKADSIPKQLEKLALPMLDIYGSNDYSRITDTAEIRALAAKNSENKNNTEGFRRSMVATSANSKIQGYIAFRQIQITGANHTFTGHQGTLVKRVLGWLDRHTKGIAVNNLL